MHIHIHHYHHYDDGIIERLEKIMAAIDDSARGFFFA
jgi:hypothetical protein